MVRRAFSHVVGFDDAPFDRCARGDVRVVGVVYAGLRMEGVVCGRVRRDGANAARRLIELIAGSQFAPQLQLIMLQGIALAGFNVVDVYALHRVLDLPVLVIARRKPRIGDIRRALLTRISGGARKWKLIERLGPMEPLAGLWVQRVGISGAESQSVIKRLAVHGRIPEPLRAAHLIAGGLATGRSRGRV